MVSKLATFNDRTIKRAREKYTNGKRGSGDDPIATHSKVAQNVLLTNLNKLLARAENKAYQTTAGLQGELDGHALIDPFLSYDENVHLIQEEYNVEFETYAQQKREAMLKDSQDQSARHAQSWLEDKTQTIATDIDHSPAALLQDALDQDGPSELEDAVTEIVTEFGESLVVESIAYLKELESLELQGAPEPTQTVTDHDDQDLGGFVDDRDEQDTLDVGRDSNTTKDRRSAIEGSTDFIDRRDVDERETEQTGLLEEAPEIEDGQTTLQNLTATPKSTQPEPESEPEPTDELEPIEPPREWKQAKWFVSHVAGWARKKVESKRQTRLDRYAKRTIIASRTK